MAQEKPGHTLEATVLVHEAYLRLVDAERAQHWNSRGHLFAAAAEAMRRILVESARGKAREKRGGDWQRVNFEELDLITFVSPLAALRQPRPPRPPALVEPLPYLAFVALLNRATLVLTDSGG